MAVMFPMWFAKYTLMVLHHALGVWWHLKVEQAKKFGAITHLTKSMGSIAMQT